MCYRSEGMGRRLYAGLLIISCDTIMKCFKSLCCAKLTPGEYPVLYKRKKLGPEHTQIFVSKCEGHGSFWGPK